MKKPISPDDLFKHLSNVSHDIRSPLSALNLVFSSIEGLSEEKAHLIKESIFRINKIADEMMTLSQNKELSAKINLNPNTQLAPEPTWYKKGLNLKSSTMLVVVDDDSHIHKMWDDKFAKSSHFKKENLMHFHSISDFRDWYYSDHRGDDVFYFVDLEFENEIETGIGLIEKLNLSHKSLLVTSKYDESWVVDKASKINLKILPKSIATNLPIRFDG